jgi:hypothetical protein
VSGGAAGPNNLFLTQVEAILLATVSGTSQALLALYAWYCRRQMFPTLTNVQSEQLLRTYPNQPSDVCNVLIALTGKPWAVDHPLAPYAICYLGRNFDSGSGYVPADRAAILRQNRTFLAAGSLAPFQRHLPVDSRTAPVVQSAPIVDDSSVAEKQQVFTFIQHLLKNSSGLGARRATAETILSSICELYASLTPPANFPWQPKDAVERLLEHCQHLEEYCLRNVLVATCYEPGLIDATLGQSGVCYFGSGSSVQEDRKRNQQLLLSGNAQHFR